MPHVHAGDTCSSQFQMERILHVFVNMALKWIQDERREKKK